MVLNTSEEGTTWLYGYTYRFALPKWISTP